MKIIISIIMLMGLNAQAAPVLNSNVASAGNAITIWPDHKDANQFYFAPTIMRLALNSQDEPLFNAIDYTVGRCGVLRRCARRLLLTAYFEAAYRDFEFEEAKLKILSLRPDARFSPVPFISSQVEFGNALMPFIDEHNCSPMGSQSSDLVPCSLILNEKGIDKLVPRLQKGSLLAFNFKYKIYGVIEGSGTQYRDFEGEYSIAVNLGGDVLLNHPDLD